MATKRKVTGTVTNVTNIGNGVVGPGAAPPVPTGAKPLPVVTQQRPVDGQPTASKAPAAGSSAPKYDTSAYDALKANYNRSVDADTARRLAQARQTADSQLKSAYVTRVQNERSLRDQLATAGIRGGATETSNIKLANQYGASVGQINSTLAQSMNEINANAAANKLAYAQDIDTKKRQYIEDREREARQTAREDEQKAYERSLTQRQQDLDRYTAWASKFVSKKKLRAQLRTAKKNGNKLLAQVINARLGFLVEQEANKAKK